MREFNVRELFKYIKDGKVGIYFRHIFKISTGITVVNFLFWELYMIISTKIFQTTITEIFKDSLLLTGFIFIKVFIVLWIISLLLLLMQRILKSVK